MHHVQKLSLGVYKFIPVKTQLLYCTVINAAAQNDTNMSFVHYKYYCFFYQQYITNLSTYRQKLGSQFLYVLFVCVSVCLSVCLSVTMQSFIAIDVLLTLDCNCLMLKIPAFERFGIILRICRYKKLMKIWNNCYLLHWPDTTFV